MRLPIMKKRVRKGEYVSFRPEIKDGKIEKKLKKSSLIESEEEMHNDPNFIEPHAFALIYKALHIDQELKGENFSIAKEALRFADGEQISREAMRKFYTDDESIKDFVADNMVVERQPDGMYGILRKSDGLMGRLNVVKFSRNLAYKIDTKIFNNRVLTDSERAGTQDGMTRKSWAKYGYDMIAKRIETQSDMSLTDVANNLFDSSFMSTWTQNVLANGEDSFNELAVNGNSDSYSAGDQNSEDGIFKLVKGVDYHIRNDNSQVVTVNGVRKVVGKQGYRFTANHLNIDPYGEVKLYGSGTDSYTGSATPTWTGNSLALVATEANSNYKMASGVSVLPYTKHRIDLMVDNGTSTSTTIKVYGSDNTTVLYQTTVTGATATTIAGEFNTAKNTSVFVEYIIATDTHTVTASTFDIVQVNEGLKGGLLLQYMDELKNIIPREYMKKRGSFMYMLDGDTIDEYEKVKSAVVIGRGDGGNYSSDVSVSNESRDSMTNNGGYPNHRGIPVVEIDYKSPLGSNVNGMYGSIILSNPKEDLYFGISPKEVTTIEFKPRLSGGGSGWEMTKIWYVDFGLANKQRISYASTGMKCQMPVPYTSNDIKATKMPVSGDVVAFATSYTLTEDDFYVYADTRDVRIVISASTLASWDSYEDAVSSTRGAGVDISTFDNFLQTTGSESLPAGTLANSTTYHFRAYYKNGKEGFLPASDNVSMETASA